MPFGKGMHIPLARSVKGGAALLKAIGVNSRTGKKLNEREVKQVKRIVGRNEELKYLPTVQAFAGLPLPTNTWSFVDLSLVPQGDGDSTRDGDRLKFHDLQFRYQWSSNGGVKDYCRIVIFQWHPNNVPVASPPAANALFLNGVIGGGADYTSFYSHDSRQQFKILYDHVVTLTYSVASTTATDIVHFYKTVRIFGKKVNKMMQYVSGSTAGTNHIYVAYCIDKAVGGATPTLQFNSKFNYHDI